MVRYESAGCPTLRASVLPDPERIARGHVFWWNAFLSVKGRVCLVAKGSVTHTVSSASGSVLFPWAKIMNVALNKQLLCLKHRTHTD